MSLPDDSPTKILALRSPKRSPSRSRLFTPGGSRNNEGEPPPSPAPAGTRTPLSPAPAASPLSRSSAPPSPAPVTPPAARRAATQPQLPHLVRHARYQTPMSSFDCLRCLRRGAFERSRLASGIAWGQSQPRSFSVTWGEQEEGWSRWGVSLARAQGMRRLGRMPAYCANACYRSLHDACVSSADSHLGTRLMLRLLTCVLPASGALSSDLPGRLSEAVDRTLWRSDVRERDNDDPVYSADSCTSLCSRTRRREMDFLRLLGRSRCFIACTRFRSTVRGRSFVPLALKRG